MRLRSKSRRHDSADGRQCGVAYACTNRHAGQIGRNNDRSTRRSPAERDVVARVAVAVCGMTAAHTGFIARSPRLRKTRAKQRQTRLALNQPALQLSARLLLQVLVTD